MAGCPNCRSLGEHPADGEPSGEIRAESVYFTPQGMVEIYRCRPCGTQWQRVVATEQLGEKSGPWKNLRAAGAVTRDS